MMLHTLLMAEALLRIASVLKFEPLQTNRGRWVGDGAGRPLMVERGLVIASVEACKTQYVTC